MSRLIGRQISSTIFSNQEKRAGGMNTFAVKYWIAENIRTHSEIINVSEKVKRSGVMLKKVITKGMRNDNMISADSSAARQAA